MSKKQKNIALIISFLITLFISYQLAISKTLTQKKQLNKLKRETLLFKDAPKKISQLKSKEIYYDSILKKYQIAESSMQNNLLKTINTFSNKNNLKLISFLKPHIITKNNLIIKTYKFILQGSYNNINKLIYQLEQKTKFGEVVNLHFKKNKNYATGKSYLQATIFLKNFGQ